MDREEERYRQAVAALHKYMEDRKNPLKGPEYVKLVKEMLAAKDALVEEQKNETQ